MISRLAQSHPIQRLSEHDHLHGIAKLTEETRARAVTQDRKSPSGRSSSYGRGRPKAGTTSEISTAIMEAATAAFLDKGFEDVSMEAIAASAGITKVTLYKRFPDKRSLLRAVVKARRQNTPPAEPSSIGIEARLKQLATTILVGGVSPELRAYHALVTTAWPDPSDMPAREEVLGYNDMLLMLEREIRLGSQELGVHSSRAQTVALALMAMLSGWFEHRSPDPSRDAADADAFARTAVDLLVHGKNAW